MGERKHFKQGDFSWADLWCRDMKQEIRFYTSVFGWDVERRKIKDAEAFARFTFGGDDVAGVAELPEGFTDPVWHGNVTVENVDIVAHRATELGATVLMEPTDVLTAGRYALLRDPCGGEIGLWQPGWHKGAALRGQPGSLCFHELVCPDGASTREFYTGLFGWKFVEGQPAYEDDLVDLILLGDQTIGAITVPGPDHPERPHGWNVYFNVTDRRAVANGLTGEGGRILTERLNTPIGPASVVTDPEGARFVLVQPEDW